MSFAEQIRKYAEQQKRRIDDIIAESIVNLSAAVIVQTPVDTGHLANNWQPTKDAPASGVVNAPTQTPAQGMVDAAQMAEVEKTVAASVGGVYYLTNNLPYARRVEFEGWSLKAPQGMLRISIENYGNYLDNAINKQN